MKNIKIILKVWSWNYKSKVQIENQKLKLQNIKLLIWT